MVKDDNYVLLLLDEGVLCSLHNLEDTPEYTTTEAMCRIC